MHQIQLPYPELQICRVRSLDKVTLAPGMLLARRGAWQHKSVIRHLFYAGTVHVQDYGGGPGATLPMDEWTVGIEYLGQFYADGRVQLAQVRPEQRVREITVRVAHGADGVIGYGLGGYDGGLVPVEPAGTQPEKVIQVIKPPRAKPQSKWSMEPSPTLALAEAAAARKPEAILADFLVD